MSVSSQEERPAARGNRARPQLSLKGRALRCLSQREHSRLELERKLREHEQTPGELARVLDELQARGFISQERVAESVVNRRASRLGTARIRQELIARGLDAQTVADTVQSLRGTEVQRAREVWKKRFGEPAPDAAGRAKQMRFLAARGFAPEVIRRVVAGGDDET